MPRTRRAIAAALVLIILALIGVNLLPPGSVAALAAEDGLVPRADKLFDDKNYAEAAKLYQKRIDEQPHDEAWRHAHHRLIAAKLRLQLFDDALAAADAYIAGTKGTPYEARAERLAGNLWLTVPHHGTRAGGEFHRAQWKQGIHVQSFQHDKRRSIAHLERARNLYAHYDRPDNADVAEAMKALPAEQREGWHAERIECSFDLAGAAARFGIYENSYQFWWSYWGERDDQRADTAGEDDFDEYHNHWQLTRKRPIGLRLGPDGKPIFPTKPGEYSSDLSDDQKILYLLDEARRLDTTDNKQFTALSYYRQAMLARARWGMDRLNQYASYYYNGNDRPLQEELETLNPWELGDHEAIVLAGGQITKVTVPRQWDVLALLHTVEGDYAGSTWEDDSQYAIGLYHQSRQQYKTALKEYDALRQRYADSSWADAASSQQSRIRHPQVRISQSGVQLPPAQNSAQPVSVQVSYRNADKVWFVAREIDHGGFMRDLRSQEVNTDKGYRYFWPLQSWHNYFANAHHHTDDVYAIAGKYIGKEVARWSDDVKDDGTHRYATATLPTPLSGRGAYLVYAYLNEPPKDHASVTGREALALGDSRAVVVLTDVAIVEKKVQEGNLYYIAHARTGAPIVGADVKGLEVWSTWDQKNRKSVYHKAMHEGTTDAQGMVLFKTPNRQRGQMHVLVDAPQAKDGGDAKPDEGERLAWTGMSYWSGYNPSRMRDGLHAYCITDRPVYRPNQDVKFKVWLRHMNNGLYENQPDSSVTVTIYDPRGNKVHEEVKQTDQWGGLDGQFTLGEEPPLGMYRIHLHGRNYMGGQNFRVEEYKKPEFEVTVEPGKDHVKLGEKVTAVIKADYYFGAPVTDATVSYKVFREQYRHSYYFPGQWDWLYGPGYGYSWYSYDWLPFWDRWSCCRVAPHWWYGYYGGSAPTPVRELVQQGEARIGGDGKLEVEIDTSRAAELHGDQDHRYVIEAEVRDASRRTIVGSGAVKVTRQAYYAMVQPQGGWYRPGEEMVIKVACMTPDNKPVQTEGVVTVSQVVFGGPNNAHIDETQLESWKASTDERGMLEFRLRHEKSGQLKIHFRAPDQWGGEVNGYAMVWVVGDDFTGKLHRFNNLEIITDKREYHPGETAHVMVNTQHSNSYVLWSQNVDNNVLLDWKLLHIPGRSTVIDVPVTKNNAPNFFIEATTVADTRVHQQSQRIVVPPEDGVLSVNVKTDKGEYKPGERANVWVEATTPDGKPAQTQVTLSAFDSSVLYIQGELTPPIAQFFHGNLRHHNMQLQTNLNEQFAAWGYVHRPFQQLHPYPESWHGVWGPTIGDWRTVESEELMSLSGAKDEFRQRAGGQGVGGLAGDAVSRNASAPAAAEPASAMRKSAQQSISLFAEADDRAGAEKPGDPSGSGGDFAEAEVRQKFADTAVWLTTLTTGEDGKASASFDMPENLTTWKLNAWAINKQTRVGQADTSAVTTKNLLVRLQAPRFFMEYDEVVLSANVHNYLDSAKTARVSIDVPEKLLKMIGDTPATVDVKVPAGGETRVDWRVQVMGEGTAAVTVKALTDEESDAMRMTFPVLVHGMMKQVATTGSMRPFEEQKTATVELIVPDERKPELTHFEVQFSPTLAGAMLDALPYCLDYPYGCTEQTMSRFLPAVLTLRTLQNMGIKLEDVRDIRGRLAEIRRFEKGENRVIYGTYADSPIFDTDQMNRIIRNGLNRIGSMQNGDGGWGWWSNNESSSYLTAYVLYALCSAQSADVEVDENMIQRGMNWLKNHEEQWMHDEHWSVQETRAFSAYVLSMKDQKAVISPGEGDKRPAELLERLWQGRDKLNNYGMSLLALAFHELDDRDRAATVVRNVMQFLQVNDETQVANLRTPEQGWWYWWNNDIETNAWFLRALVAVEPKHEAAPKIVKWLLNNRHNGYYWRSTRDTTLVVHAMSDFVVATGEGQADYELTFDLDNGAVVKKVKISPDNFFTYDNRFIVDGVALGGGKHTLKITKSGKGALYFNSYLRYFTKEKHITASGHELKVDRKYFRLEQIPYEVEVETADGSKVMEKRLRYQRVPVNHGDQVASGDVVQVELKVTSDNNYTYLAFEDMKPAGFEAVELRSGSEGQEGFYSYMELRDEKTVFFVGSLQQGEHLLRYRLRAEAPGVFHALPTKLYAMYVPELKANGEEQVIRIVD